MFQRATPSTVTSLDTSIPLGLWHKTRVAQDAHGELKDACNAAVTGTWQSYKTTDQGCRCEAKDEATKSRQCTGQARKLMLKKKSSTKNALCHYLNLGFRV